MCCIMCSIVRERFRFCSYTPFKWPADFSFRLLLDTICRSDLQCTFSLTILNCRHIFLYLYFNYLGIALVSQSVGWVSYRRISVGSYWVLSSIMPALGPQQYDASVRSLAVWCQHWVLSSMVLVLGLQQYNTSVQVQVQAGINAGNRFRQFQRQLQRQG